MCQAIPRQVLQVAEGRAQVLVDGRPTWVNTLALPDVAPGDYVVVYAGAAVERISEADALELLRFLAAMAEMFEDEQPAPPQERTLP